MPRLSSPIQKHYYGLERVASQKFIFVACIFIACTMFLTVSSEYIPPGPKYRCPESQSILYPCTCNKGSDVGLYVECANSNLASLSVALRNLASLQLPIEELSIKDGKFKTIYGTIFHKLTTRILKIINTPINSIEDEFVFYGINNTLQELHLLHTKLTIFPKVPFQVLGNLSVLFIEHHNLTNLAKDELVGSALSNRLEKLSLANGKIQSFSPDTFQNLKKLKYLDLNNNSLANLQRNQFKGLREVEVLDISFNQIQKLDSSHIADLTKLGWCNVSHNDLNELTRGSFARNSVLKVLNMSHNKIKRLDSNSFRGMRFMRRLFLSDNMISDIGRSTFGAVTRIGTIDLARNLIKKIDYQMFYQLNYVELIDMSQNEITEIQKQSFTDLYLAKINISYNNIQSIENNAFINCVNMSVLDLSHNQISEIHHNVFDMNTYATDFQLSYNKLTNMSQVPLHNMTGLKVLNVSYNAIADVPKKTFPKLYELHTVDLSHNNVSIIANGVFQTLFSLRYLNLSYNQLDKIKPSTFGALSTLLEIDLSNNILTDVSKGSLASLSSASYINLENNMLEKIFQIPISLSRLNLRKNWLMEIPENTWPVMNALLTLDLGKNRLSNNLRGGAFAGLLTLQTLFLNDNGIMSVPKESIANLNTLQYLHLENNNITHLGKSAFGKLPIVFELHLYNNNINTISPRAFDGMLQLLTLNLSQNALKYVPNEAFYGLVSLRKLDFSFNIIEKLDNKTNGLLDDCLSLEEINLSHNKISFLTRKSFPSSPYIPYRLKSIDLSYNQMPTLTYDLTFGTQKVTYLNVSHNNLNDIRKSVIGNLSSIEVLDLSFNELTNLQMVETFVLPKSLTHLYLQNNRIGIFPVDKINHLPKLKKVDLRNNELTTFNNSLIQKIQLGTDFLFQGNKLICDCKLRPLLHYLKTLLKPPLELKDLTCLADEEKVIFEIEDKHLSCSNENDTNNELFGLQPDLKFRKISYKRNKGLDLEFFVTTREDVADFYMNIKKGSTILYERHLSYDSRSLNVESSLIRNLNDLTLCVLAKNSRGQILRWFDSQCISLSTNNEFELYQTKNYKGLGSMQQLSNSDNRIIFQSKTNFALLFTSTFFVMKIR